MCPACSIPFIQMELEVSELRVLLPSSEHPSWLGNKAVAKCPTEQACCASSEFHCWACRSFFPGFPSTLGLLW